MTTVANETIRLICLDFDGTSVDYNEGLAFLNAEVVSLLNDAAGSGIAWCTNSGRTFEDQLQILSDSRKRGLNAPPEALMCGESFLYLREDGAYVSHLEWNERAVKTLSEFHGEVRRRYAPELHEIALRYEAEKMLFDDAATAYLIPTSEDSVLNACLQDIQVLVQDLPHAFASRNGGWIFVGHRQFSKGRVLDVYLRQRGLSPGEAVAVGDNLNDVDMLDGSVCRNVGCPADSLPEVQEVVRRAGGRVSAKSGPAGTLDVLTYYLRGA